jgi:ribosomal protein S18 acetylase RimI-like enzyme
MKVEYSKIESELFGVKFGRFEGKVEELLAQAAIIQSDQFDFIRAKLLQPNHDLFAQLTKLNRSYHLLDIHRHYSLDTQQHPVALHANNQIELKLCTAADKSILYDLVINTFTDAPLGYFAHPVMEQFFPLDEQLHNFATYMNTVYDATNANKKAWRIEAEGKTIGCCSTDFKGEEAYTTYIGLLPEFRKMSLYRHVINRMQVEIQQAGARYITGSARLHNLASQATFEKEAEQYTHHDYVFMLMPVLVS